MVIAYLDCFSGISGDMFLGALIDAGVDPKVLQDATAALNLGASLKMERVDRSGISSTKAHVLERGNLAEDMSAHHHPESSQKQNAVPVVRSSQQQTQHLHKIDPAQAHRREPESAHVHAHGRSLSVIRELIQRSGLSAPVICTAVRAFELLGASEAKIHNVSIDEIHFHEVGAVDAIVDIVAASAGIHALGAGKWVASPLNVGGGMVDCAHGRFPVPAPATADLLRGFPSYSSNLQMELVTPTGAALVRTLVEERGMVFGPQPAMRVQRIGYGAGSRNPEGFPNVVRLLVGEAEGASGPSSEADRNVETVTVLETALDDLSPQLIAHVAETALDSGALDVMLTPVIMKKGRPGTLITLLCKPEDRAQFEELLLRETTTLGVRIREDRRVSLDRSFQTVHTPFGPIRIKLGLRGGEMLNAHPEFEDCRTAAAAHDVPVKLVHQAAVAAYFARTEGVGSDD